MHTHPRPVSTAMVSAEPQMSCRSVRRPFAVSCRQDSEGTTLLEVSGAIDFAARDALLETANAVRLVYPELEVDANNVDFIDAAGLGALIELVGVLRHEGALVSIQRRSQALQYVLDLLDIA